MTAQILLILRLAATVSLYLFFGAALYLLWRDFRRHSQMSTNTQTQALELAVIADSGSPRRLRFRTSEIILGRDPASDCVLDHPTVSAQHARLTFRQSHWWLEDLRSTNGTYLNHEAVVSPVVIAHLDLVGCGQVQLQINLEGEPEAHQT